MLGLIKQSEFDHEHSLRLAAEENARIKQSDFDREHELRLVAEQNARNLLTQLTQANERVDALVLQNEREREAHREEIQSTLDRFAPKPMLVTEPDGQPQRQYTSEVARNVRAVGKSDMRFRNAEVHRLENEELSKEERDDRARRQALLTEEEKKGLSQSEGDLLDSMLSRIKPKEEVTA